MSDSPSTRIYVNKIENKITFRIKTGYYPEILTSETIKLLSIITKDANGDSLIIEYQK